jgi:hypothetical protein
MEQRMRTMRVLWLAITLSSVVLFFVLLAVRRSQPAAAPQVPVMLPALGAVAAMVAAVSFVMPRVMLRTAFARLDARIEEEPDPHAEPSLFRHAAPMRRVFVEPEAALSRAVPAFHTGLILSLALSEAVAMFGLVLGMQGFELLHVLPFFVVSAILCALRFPTVGRIQRLLEHAKSASFRR